jgi:hypothetical protein
MEHKTMNDAERAAWETMKAWREALAISRPGNKQYEEIEKQLREAEAAYYRVMD